MDSTKLEPVSPNEQFSHSSSTFVFKIALARNWPNHKLAFAVEANKIQFLVSCSGAGRSIFELWTELGKLFTPVSSLNAKITRLTTFLFNLANVQIQMYHE